MSGDWFKFYEDSVHNSKLLKLSDALYRAWTILLCFASKNGGYLPPAEDIATTLREKPAKVAEWITKLKAAGLFDLVDGKFIPHDWEERQYKVKDATAATRMQRYRARKGKSVTDRNVTPVTTVTPLRLEEEVDREVEREKSSEPNGSGAVAPRDYRAELFSRGLAKLASLTGKGQDSCRSFVGKCLKAAGDDAVTVLGLIDDAERNQVVDPSAWIAARLKATGPPQVRATTVYQQNRQEAQEIINELGNFAAGSGNSSQADTRLLPGNSGERSEELRSGTGANVIDLPAGSHRASG
jgi:hypothetical protein